MIKESKLKAERRANGLCIDCGGPKDEAKYIRCKACRQVHGALKNAWYAEHKKSEEDKKAETRKMVLEAQRKAIEKQIARDKRILQANRCMKCPYGTFTGVSVHCPFPEGVCMKR